MIMNVQEFTLTPELRLWGGSGRADILADRRGDDLADLALSCLGGTGIWEMRYGDVEPSLPFSERCSFNAYCWRASESSCK